MRRHEILKRFAGLIAVFMLAAGITAASALAVASHGDGSPRSGALHVTKECSRYNGQPGSLCTITSSNLNAIDAGMNVVYTSRAGATSAATSKRPEGKAPGVRPTSTRVQQRTTRSCTMAEPSTRVTVEVEIANAADFCELVSHALAGEVLRSSVVVTPGLLWHYADATLSCRLRYGSTPARMTIHNSPAACRWLSRLARSWHLESQLAG